MFKVTRGYVLAAALTDDTKSDEKPYPVYSSQTKDSGLMGYYRDYLYEDAITWTTDGANAGTVNYRAGKFYCTNVCGVLLSDRINASQMVAEALNNVAKGYVSYVGNPKLMNNIMADIEIMIPVSSMEQKMISDYFATLDRLVALHQCNCNMATRPCEWSSGLRAIAWEQRKLGEVGTTFTGLSGKKASDFGHGKASLITYMNVFSNPIANPNMIENVEVDSRQREVEVGDVFFTTSSETPEEVGMSSVLKKKIGITYLNSFCFGFRPSVKFDLDYLAFMLRSESVRKQIKLLAQGISRFNIAKTKMMYIDIQVPKIDEQIAIGKYFAQLDRLITLHQRKHILLT